MARFRSTGALDDPFLVDGDGLFVGVDNRVGIGQLGSGYLFESRNGRIDGGWSPRRGIEALTAGMDLENNPLQLPFWLFSSAITVSSASRSSNVITLQLSTVHGIPVGQSWYVSIGTPGSGVEPVTGVAAGTYLMTSTTTSRLTFANVGANGSLTVDGTHGKVWTYIYDGAVLGVWGSCLFSDPNSNSDESVLIATNTVCKRFSLSDRSFTDLTYPSGTILQNDVNLLQAFDRVYLFRDGEQTFEWVAGGRNIEAADYTSSSGIVSVTLRSHGMSVGDTFTVSDLGFATTDPNGSHTVTTVTDVDTFEYVISTGGGDETYTSLTGKVIVNGFTKVPGGAYSQPVRINGSNNTTVSDGVVTVSATAHGLKVGQQIVVIDSGAGTLTDGETYVVATVPTVNSFTFYATKEDSSSHTVSYMIRQSVGGGYSHMTAPPWGVYFQRRLWTPFYYTAGGTASSPTYSDRERRDELIVSDILDSNTYDQIEGQFRITGGTADYLVGFWPFYEDQLLVLNRNSLHVISGTAGSLQDTTVREMTREVGCISRKSLAGQGNSVFFLSDNGVYGLEFGDEYNLRGVREPLSKPIQPLIDRINKDLAPESVGIFFENRYYLAIPLDGENGEEAQGNNAVIVYNILNQAWESVDTYGNGNVFVRDFIIGRAETRNNLYFVSREGGLHQLGVRDNATDLFLLDLVGTVQQTPVDYRMITRGYRFGNLAMKKYHRASVEIESNLDNQTDVELLFSTEDPDSEAVSLGFASTFLGNNIPAGDQASIRFRLGNPRGVYGSIQIRGKNVGLSPVGRPTIRGVSVEATSNSGQTISYE